ncbi:ABC transporter substrate-binding protein [Aquipuribacter sp. MA13-6]|uniref:ABC transporter substrate-binding protein n=1 Tax=unclassified Aquipuribacter TaxID=2635084 RepID=UPI003EEFEC38
MRAHRTPWLVITTAAVLTLAACGGSSSADDEATGAVGAGGEAAEDVSGDITVLTNRTDLVDTTFAEYKETFEGLYPEVTVNFEAITDYEGEVRIRMNTSDYGDVLLIPNSITADQLPSFFSPLGSVEELGEEYRYVNEQAYEGEVYGLAIVGNAQGMVYNKAVWEEAGITEPPATPEEFQSALQAIADSTDAVPLYTNYADGWPLTQIENNRGAISANPDAVNELVQSDAPWAEGEEHYIMDSLIFDAVEAGLTEDDPTTTEWELSKELLATGQVATMVLGSWSVVQMQELADDPDNIGFMPFPNQVDGTFYSASAGDYKNAVNVNSENQEAARAWVDWFANESGYAEDQGGLTPRLDGPNPETLADFEELGVELLEINPAPAGEEGLVQNIDAAAEIGLFEPIYRQRLVDAARGASDETKEQIFEDLNTRWAEARAAVTAE